MHSESRKLEFSVKMGDGLGDFVRQKSSLKYSLSKLLMDACACYLHYLPRLHRQSGEVPAAVDGDALRQNRVQTPHLIPGQHAEPPALIRSSGHGDQKKKVFKKEKKCFFPPLWVS